MRHFETKLEEEGLEIDEDEPDHDEAEADTLPNGVEMGSGGKEAAFANQGKVEGEGVTATVGKAMEAMGLAGRGKPNGVKKRRKGMDGLVDV